MKATLKITDIGGLRGEHTFQLERGKLNIIESSNSGGKTSIVRALTGVLSIPRDGVFDSFTLNEALKVGIKTDERNPQEGFVNVHAKTGEIELKLNDFTENYIVKQNGQAVQVPKDGDQRFLLAGILSNDTKILRQLHGVEENEPDDFKWAVTELSFAHNYDLIKDSLTSFREDTIEKSHQIEDVQKEIGDLNNQKLKLEKELKKNEEELNKLKPRFKKGVEKDLKKREDIANKINNINIEIGEKKGELARSIDEYNKRKKSLEQYENKIEKISKELTFLDVEKVEKDKKTRREEIENNVSTLKDKRAGIDSLMNLFVTAQASLKKKSDNVKCPLCSNGNITYNMISKKLNDYRKERDNYSGQISELNQELFETTQKANKIIEKRNKLLGELTTARTELRTAEKELNYRVDHKEALETDIDRKSDEIKKSQKDLDEIISRIGKSDEEINKKYTELEELERHNSIELGIVIEQMGKSSIDIGGHQIKPEIAKKICGKWLDFINKSLEYVKEKAEEQRQKASKRFNDNIADLMNELGFKEFRNIQLNVDYRLYVERLSPKTNEYVAQQVQTLSTSEKLTIALILQSALKETYIPNIPFFIIDDIMEDFDPERREKIKHYLIAKAKDEDWFVVITKLVEKSNKLKINYMGV